jgi:hypothetical protein
VFVVQIRAGKVGKYCRSKACRLEYKNEWRGENGRGDPKKIKAQKERHRKKHSVKLAEKQRGRNLKNKAERSNYNKARYDSAELDLKGLTYSGKTLQRTQDWIDDHPKTVKLNRRLGRESRQERTLPAARDDLPFEPWEDEILSLPVLPMRLVDICLRMERSYSRVSWRRHTLRNPKKS